MNHKFTINSSDDESTEIFLDGELIAYLSHDEHGWLGMEAVESSVRKIAQKLGIEVEEI